MDVLHMEQAVEIQGQGMQRDLSEDQTWTSWGTPNQAIHQPQDIKRLLGKVGGSVRLTYAGTGS